ncbi:hypothetical protein [Roseateles saccharophilus]|uniref:Uncharacterized protein n=1 Tax=Roseateles saccharophilus TaxID=304 RepID=A0A4R3UJA9_ROSSA|nr:hypothetical protein [Roseateles saccharophilus]MDG0834856.1 hypothetical protein [Roseateles saccharophilus]TCU88390.1 hypothetical protein EV671_103916 [Roseateles saccharophilus]
MNVVTNIVALASAAMLAAPAQAQFVKGNEAVSVRADGARKVETPPIPSATLGPPCKAVDPACWSLGAWLMLETADGLQECTELYARPETCRASTFGSLKRLRLWVVKVKGQWMQCPRPDIDSGCLSTKALPPVTTVQ